MSHENSISLLIDGDRTDRDNFSQELSQDEKLDVRYTIYETIEALPLILSIYGATLSTIQLIIKLYEKRKKANPSVHVTIKLPNGESFDLDNLRMENLEGKIPQEPTNLKMYEVVPLQSSKTPNGIVFMEEELMKSARTLYGGKILYQDMTLDSYFNRVKYSEFEDDRIKVKMILGNEKVNQLIADGRITGICVKGSYRYIQDSAPVGLVLDSLILVDDVSNVKTDYCGEGELRSVIYGPLMAPPRLIKEF